MDKKKIKLLVEMVLFIGALCLITFFYYFDNSDLENDYEPSEVGIVQITDDNFESEVLNSDKPVVLEFYSNNCPPCLTMVPTMISIAKNNQDIKVVTANSSDERVSKIASKYNVEATPTILIFKEGEVVKEFIGATNEETIMKEI